MKKKTKPLRWLFEAGKREMMKPLHELTDNEKTALLDEMERLGLLQKDASGRTRLTERGNHFGCMLLALKTIEDLAQQVGYKPYPGAH